MKIIIYDEQYNTKLHGGGSEWTSAIYSVFRKKYNTEIISLRKTVFNNRLFLFPYLREFLVYPLHYLFSKKKMIGDIFLFNSTFTNAFSGPPDKSMLIVHCLFSLQFRKIKKIYKNIFRQIIILFIENICFFYERMSIKRFKFVVCPREDIKNFIIDNFKIKTECIILPQFASSLSFFNIKGTEKKYDFIFIGRNSKPKGFLDLIDLAIRNPTTRIVVCGNIREKRYRDIKNIIFLGKVTKDILNRTINQSKVLFMPSYSETGPLVTIESLMSGTPVISSIEGGGVFVKDGINGFIYKNYDSKKVYEYFEKITADYDFFSENSMKMAKEFGIEKIILKLEKLIQSI